MASVRLFVAIEIPPEIRRALSGLLAPLRAQKSSVKWERTEKLHVTLRFIGETTLEAIPGIVAALQRAAKQAPGPFTVCFASPGCFPNRQRPRVLWIGMDDSGKAAIQLQGAINLELRAIGIEDDDKEFHPHVTVGRVRTQTLPSRLLEDFEKLTLHTDQVIVDQFVLMRSDLRTDGSQYSVIARIPLGGAAA